MSREWVTLRSTVSAPDDLETMQEARFAVWIAVVLRVASIGISRGRQVGRTPSEE